MFLYLYLERYFKFNFFYLGVNINVYMNKIYTTIVLLSFFLENFASNEFYINGATVVVNGKASTTVATLRVNGEIINNKGDFNNKAGLIEVTGDWTNTPTVSEYYQSTGIERFIGDNDQTIKGTWNGTSTTVNQFNDLKIKKIATSGQYINLATNVNINSTGTLDFESDFGVIRTDVSSHTDDGSLYPNELFFRNSDPTKMTNYSWSSFSLFGNSGGATTKYIEGKLRLAVVQNKSYNFPVGVANTSLDGMEGVSVAFSNTSTFSTDVLAFIQPAGIPSYISDLAANNSVLFYDIGSLPATAPANQFQNCVGTPDGHDDVAIIDAAASHEWILTASAATSKYDLSVYPGSALDNLGYINMGTPCNSMYQKTKYLARNGIIGGDEAVGPTINYWVPGVTGYYQKPNGNKLSGQGGFSRFRMFGTTNSTNTSLPVELVNLQAQPINNEYINVSWVTASELNNKGFELQRSTNNGGFDSIGWINGNGTSSIANIYSYNDMNVMKGVTYYYRLKQIDYTNAINYSYVVNARLVASGIESITLFPNPSESTSSIQILSSANDQYSIEAYDYLGQNMFTSKLDTKANIISNIQIPSSNWATGIYLIKAKSLNNSSSKSLKFIKN